MKKTCKKFGCLFAMPYLCRRKRNRKVAQLVAHYVRDVGVGRSSRLFPTMQTTLTFPRKAASFLSFFDGPLISLNVKTDELIRLYAGHPGMSAMDKVWNDDVKSVFLQGLLCSSASLFLAAQARHGVLQQCPVLLAVLSDNEEAAYFYHDLTQLLGDKDVLFFPSAYKRAAKYRQKDDAAEVLRAEVLTRLEARPKASLLLVTYPEALAEGVVARHVLADCMVPLAVGQTVDVRQLAARLEELGFQRVDYVYEPGQYALRGSIMDVFSYSSELPYRFDFFGDDIDSIRSFEVESQLSQDKFSSVTLTPELDPSKPILNPSMVFAPPPGSPVCRGRATRGEGLSGSASVLSRKEENSVTQAPPFGRGGGWAPLMSYLPQDSAVLFRDLLYAAERVEAVWQENQEPTLYPSQREGLDVPEAAYAPPEGRGQGWAPGTFLDGATFRRSLLPFRRIEFGAHATGTPDAVIHFDTEPQPLFHKNFDLVAKHCLDTLADGSRLFILSDSAKQTDRLATIFMERGEAVDFEPVERTLHEGFADHTLRCCFYTDHQIFDRFHKYSLRSDRARRGKVAVSLKELSQFVPGDYVVHIDHGVGRFAGLVRVPNPDGTSQEVIKLEYGGGSVVLVSIHSLHKISKYKSRDGEAPRLGVLGTGAWERLKERTKTKIKDIARDLILLYSQRQQQEGFAFSHDSFLQHELEASFLYEDTPDQSRATQDVKADMERARPMDRLVCGDVGFGKTEVAIRAAFKACADNKQVAVLVPTTVLAYQHYQTFSERLRNFPCRIEYLSRSRTATQVKQILADLAEGKIDILIGTHKLIGRQVRFKDLGLLIIDEEQKFGVSVKERLKQMKVNVDTLTLTATPIPRTLQFSLMGARDLSVISTPPVNRYPIQTEVHTFNEDIIREAINYEMARGGQVFFINNRVQNLPELADLIHRLVPDCRVAIGHGQMPPEKLEQVVMDFMNFDYDVLLATSIVENGIDIPNANTIIINQAHMFGLSDLHQMRGRVGRTNKKAFCYLLAPPLTTITPEARRRLQAIENFTDLGSGIHIAMQDLDIRGAGNLLGAEQSGFIADLGYETYQKILAQAVHELKTDEFADVVQAEVQQGTGTYVDDCTLESDLELLFPDSYIPVSGERILIYRELDSLETDEQVDAFRRRLVDRFGPIPREGEELLCVVPMRRLARQLGIEKIVLRQQRMVLYLVGDDHSPYYQSDTFGKVLGYHAFCPYECRYRMEGKRNLLINGVTTVRNALAVLRQIDSVKV